MTGPFQNGDNKPTRLTGSCGGEKKPCVITATQMEQGVWPWFKAS